jgi:peptide deformylase
MPLLDIVTLPNPVLRRKARKVTEIDADLQLLIDSMIVTMREAPGVGLAAPQIGASIRLVVVEYGEEDEEGEEVSPKKLYTLVNPEIVLASEEKEMGIEACLSIPGLVGEVERHSAIVIKGLNRHGKPTKVKAHGWLARIFQHEIDHLEGVLFTDLTDQLWRPEEHPDRQVPLD